MASSKLSLKRVIANIYDKTTEHILYDLDQSTEWFAERFWKHGILPPANRIFLSVLSKTIMPIQRLLFIVFVIIYSTNNESVAFTVRRFSGTPSNYVLKKRQI